MTVNLIKHIWAWLAVLLIAPAVVAFGDIIRPDLTRVSPDAGWRVADRTASVLASDGKKGVRFDQQSSIGLAWLERIEFSEGEIEVDCRGVNGNEQSSLGIAFRLVNERIYDAVYFRPLNFKSDDPVRKSRSVQYVSHPNYTSRQLRDEKPGRYESAISPAPNPNSWFHVRLVIEKRTVKVFIDNDKIPCLVVDELSERNRGGIGLWVGDGSGGDFANLRITRREK